MEENKNKNHTHHTLSDALKYHPIHLEYEYGHWSC